MDGSPRLPSPATEVVERGEHIAGGLIAAAAAAAVVVALVVLVLFKSFHSIGSLQVGLVSKRFGFRKLGHDDPVAFRGEAGFQAKLLMPGLRFKFWPMFGVKKYPWVQVPAGEIGVVIAQVGVQIKQNEAEARRAEGQITIVPEVLVTGGGSVEGLAATLMRQLTRGGPLLGGTRDAAGGPADGEPAAGPGAVARDTADAPADVAVAPAEVVVPDEAVPPGPDEKA